ncbi:hypothetical protein CANTEDRAFT_112927 [Yamadazyma tenuis ATCC 10573]|nr:uncharacterized protein CANTEDRAFT_112927 [Yamadazyma tenuis ATCC 10573]EGV66299.1 hypothetical protein CANTEDRAFT_112927 [Yamadazyma tenuis ATCC 10573]
MVQCVVSLGSILPMWNNQFSLNRVNDTVGSVYGYYPYGGLVASLAIAYFIWDTYVCLRHFSSFGFGFLFHGVAALFVFGSTLQPFCMSWVPSFLLFEASTPFVNVNWFSSRLPGIVPEKIVVVNGILLLISFFSVRILWGFYAMSLVATDLYRTWGMNHWVFPVGLVVINLSLDALNVYWFYKMLRIAAKKIRGTKSPKSLAKEAAEKID